MAKKNLKKQTNKPESKGLIKKGAKSKSKMNPGKKSCKSCGKVIPIHQKVCGSCGHVHEMKKKKKEDIMKNLNKITPILIKSIIENNDFNEFETWDEEIVFEIGSLSAKLSETSVPQLNKTKSDTKTNKKKNAPTSKNQSESSNSLRFKPTSHSLFDYMIINQHAKCLGVSKNWFVFVENVNKFGVGLEEKERITIEAYKLHNFNLVGVEYGGESIVHFSNTSDENLQPTEYVFHQIFVNKHISKVKVFANLVAMLTGQNSLLIISLPSKETAKSSVDYDIADQLEIIEPSPDSISAFEFLRATAIGEGNTSMNLVVGTLLGSISIYNIEKGGYHIVKHIPHAHNEMVTCISECPLNSKNGILFASGCYDGNISVWDMEERNPIFSYECSNRKIWSVCWDPGAKFIFVNRDELTDNCIIICFYSIHKIESSIHFASTIETRTVKNLKYRTIMDHDYYSKSLPVLDPIKGILKILPFEELRSNSLKKKKPKKEEIPEKCYRIMKKENNAEIEEIPQGDEEAAGEEDSNDEKKFPIFSDIAIQAKKKVEYVYISSFDGMITVFKNKVK